MLISKEKNAAGTRNESNEGLLNRYIYNRNLLLYYLVEKKATRANMDSSSGQHQLEYRGFMKGKAITWVVNLF
jgi:hypothetical protein